MTGDEQTDLVETAVGAGRGVFAPTTNTAFVLNETAARIWDLTRAGLSVTEVAGQLSEETATPLEVVGPHVARVVDELVRQGLLPGAGP